MENDLRTSHELTKAAFEEFQEKLDAIKPRMYLAIILDKHDPEERSGGIHIAQCGSRPEMIGMLALMHKQMLDEAPSMMKKDTGADLIDVLLEGMKAQAAKKK